MGIKPAEVQGHNIRNVSNIHGTVYLEYPHFQQPDV